MTDPHNVGAVLRSAEVFGARAVVAPHRHSAPETGALAKAASGALERQPYLRVPNLASAIEALKGMGYTIVGLDGTGDMSLAAAVASGAGVPLALALGAEGPGLRDLTRRLCDRLARIPASGDFGRSTSRTRRRWRSTRRRAKAADAITNSCADLFGWGVSNHIKRRSSRCSLPLLLHLTVPRSNWRPVFPGASL